MLKMASLKKAASTDPRAWPLAVHRALGLRASGHCDVLPGFWNNAFIARTERYREWRTLVLRA
jgi:hypothetical protein